MIDVSDDHDVALAFDKFVDVSKEILDGVDAASAVGSVGVGYGGLDNSVDAAGIDNDEVDTLLAANVHTIVDVSCERQADDVLDIGMETDYSTHETNLCMDLEQQIGYILGRKLEYYRYNKRTLCCTVLDDAYFDLECCHCYCHYHHYAYFCYYFSWNLPLGVCLEFEDCRFR